MALRLEHINFNSIKVRLKRNLHLYPLPIIIFQFHKGTIKTWFQAVSSTIDGLFQFHKGTIKTSYLTN